MAKKKTETRKSSEQIVKKVADIKPVSQRKEKSSVLKSISSSMKAPYEMNSSNRGTEISHKLKGVEDTDSLFRMAFAPEKVDAKGSKGKALGHKVDKYYKVKKEASGNHEAYAVDSDITASMSISGIDINRDTYDQFDLYAQHLIALLNTDVYTVANLAKHERFILFRYFYRTNPIVGRILDLHTEIALSKVRLEAPQNAPTIVRDYVMSFYNKIFERLDLMEKFKDLVLQDFIYGESYAVVDDYYKEEPNCLQDIESIAVSNFVPSREDSVFMSNIENRYIEDPLKVPVSDRLRYLNTKFINFNARYRGPVDFRVIKFYYISEYFKNDDIDYDAIRLELSQGFRNLLSNPQITVEDLRDIGYSEGMLSLVKQFSNTSIIIDNNYLSGEPYIMNFDKFEGSSLLYRVTDACLEYDAAKRALKAKLRLLGKAGRVVTSEGLSEEQLQDLTNEVEFMMDHPTHAIVANYNINWQEVNDFVKSELNDLVTSIDRIKSELSDGLGMPASLISGESQYTGDTIKIEIINNQYFALKLKFQNLINKRFIKPIAIRKGFITLDQWGEPVLIYPKVAFSLTNLRSQDVFDTLFQLYQKGSLPVDVLYDVLNLDGDAMEAALRKDLWTLKNDKANEIVSSIYGAASEEMVQNTNVLAKIMQALGLTRQEEKTEEDGMGDSEYNMESNSMPESDVTLEESEPYEPPM